MREYVVENEFVKAVRKAGGVAYKFTKKMGCKKINFYQIPVENLELIMAALRAYRG